MCITSVNAVVSFITRKTKLITILCHNFHSSGNVLMNNPLKDWNSLNFKLYGPLSQKVIRENVSKKVYDGSSYDEPTIPIEDNTKNILNLGDNYKSYCHREFSSSQTYDHLYKSKDQCMDYFKSVLNFPLQKSSDIVDRFISHSDQNTLPNKLYSIKPPSVTYILNKTRSERSEYFLNQWKLKQIQLMGLDNFEKEQKQTLQNGSDLHIVMKQILEGKHVDDLSITENIEGYWKSMKCILSDVKKSHLVEQDVYHPQLHYHGILDGLIDFKGNLTLVDWKISKKQKPYLSRTFDFPLQVVAYLGALNFDNSQLFECLNGVIVVCYHDGSPAHALHMTQSQCVWYWQEWLKRLYTYWQSVDDELNLDYSS